MKIDNNVKRFNLKSFLLSVNFFITPFLIVFLVVVIYRFIDNPHLDYIFQSDNRDGFVFLSNIATLITFIISCLLALNADDSISKNSVSLSWKKILKLGFIIGAIYILNSLTMTYIYGLFGIDSTSNNTENITLILKNKNFLMYFLVLVAAPVGEELAFKYGIFTFIHEIFYDKNKFFSIILPALVSATIFGVIHDGFYLLPLYFLPTFISCLVYYKYKNLLPCIIGHFITNFIAVSITFLF